MKLNSRMQYALVILQELLQNKTAGNIRLQEISDKYKISIHFLEQVARDLRIAGIINSKKGPGGGYYTERSSVRVSELVNAVSKTDLKISVEQEGAKQLIERVQNKIDKAIDGVDLLNE